MALSFEQFQALRQQGLSVDQITRFSSGQKPATQEAQMPLFAPLAPESKTSFIDDIKKSLDERYRKAMTAPTVLGGIAQGFGFTSDIANTALGRVAQKILPADFNEQPLVVKAAQGWSDLKTAIKNAPQKETTTSILGIPGTYKTHPAGTFQDTINEMNQVHPNIMAAGEIAGHALNLAATADLAKGAVDLTKAGVKGTIDAVEQAKIGAQMLKKTPKEAAAESLAKATTNDAKIIADNAEQYRKIIRPSKPDINKLEIKSGKSVDEAMQRIAEQSPIIYKTPEGGMDTRAASQQMRGAGYQIHDEIAAPMLQTRPEVKFDLMDVAREVKRGMSKEISNASELAAREAQVDRYIADEIARYKTAFVDGVVADRIKTGMWSQGYDLMQPTANSTARKIGNALRRRIEDAFPDLPIGEVNRLQGAYYDAANLLDSAHGRVVQNGRLGSLMARATGGTVGSVAGAAAGGGVVGSAVGGIAGASAAGKVTDFLTSPERLTTKLAKKASIISTPTDAERLVSGAKASTQDAQAALAKRQSAAGIAARQAAENAKYAKMSSPVTQSPTRALPEPAIRLPDQQIYRPTTLGQKPAETIQIRPGQRALPEPPIRMPYKETPSGSAIPAPRMLPQRNPSTGQMQRVYASSANTQPPRELPKLSKKLRELPYPANVVEGRTLNAVSAATQPKDVSFVSPNEAVDLQFKDAVKRVKSPEHLKAIQEFEKISRQDGIKGQTKSGIGVWSDGAEDTSYFVSSERVDPEKFVYDNAKKALITNQKQFISFVSDPAGKDELYSFSFKGKNPKAISDILSKNGIVYQTIGEGEVLIFNKAGEYFDNEIVAKLEKVATQLKLDKSSISLYNGNGDFYGSWLPGEEARAEARQIYSDIIASYEKKYGKPGKGKKGRVQGKQR